MNTYPNQKVIHINKEKYSSNFLQIGISEWEEAFKELKPSSFALYLYLASNANGFDLALSQKAVENAIGIKKTAYHAAVNELTEKGYISTIQGNVEVFFTKPVRKNELQNKEEKMEVRKNELQSSQMRTKNSAKTNLEVRVCDIEIDNINKNIKINNGDGSCEIQDKDGEKVQEEIEIENETIAAEVQKKSRIINLASINRPSPALKVQKEEAEEDLSFLERDFGEFMLYNEQSSNLMDNYSY